MNIELYTPFKGRSIHALQEVEVYRNLHKDCWSIRDAKSKLVLGYAKELALHDASFIVNEKGRQRVLKEKKKNVHAFVRGYIVFAKVPVTGTKVVYNPYKFKNFVTVNHDSFKVIHHDLTAMLTENMEVYV